MSRRGGLVKGKRKAKPTDKKSDPAGSISQDMQKTHHEAQLNKVQLLQIVLKSHVLITILVYSQKKQLILLVNII